MDKKLTNEQLVALIYNELSEQEATTINELLKKDPEAMQRYDALMAIRSGLSKVKDVEVEAPMILFSDHGSQSNTLTMLNNPYLKRILAVAAVFLLLLVVGRLTGLQIIKQEGAVTIAFSPISENKSNQPISDKNAEVAKTVDSLQKFNYVALQQKNAVLTKQVEMLKNSIANVQQSFDRSTVGSDKLSEANIQLIIDQISDKNYKYFTGALEASNVRQEDYIKSLFNNFAIYLDEQRIQDLRNIEHTLINLKQESEIKNLETEEVIAKLIKSVNDKSY